MQRLYYRKGRYYAEYSDAVSGIPSYERVSLMGPMERGWTHFLIEDLPGGVKLITKMP